MNRWAIALVSMGLLATGCAPNGDGATSPPTATSSPDEDVAGVVAGRVVASGLAGPTQIAVSDDGAWWIAVLNGDEDDRQGQVVTIDPNDANLAPRVVIDGLDKPTGVAIFDGELWVMERDRLTRGPMDGGGRDIIVEDLPNNGRSEGTLTVDGDRLLFNTSGTMRDGAVVEDSGALWAVTADGEIAEVASGFKNAYAHVRTADGALVTTEIGDGSDDGQPPDDELVVVKPGVDHGWPRCVGDNRPVDQYGGTAEECGSLPPSLAVFSPGATPTSIVEAPWADDLLLVALWNEGRVVAIDPSNVGGAPRTVLDGTRLEAVEHPQHLVVFGDSVLVTDHTAGSVIELTAR